MGSVVIDVGRKSCPAGVFEFAPTTAEQNRSFSTVYSVQLLYLHAIMSLMLTRFNGTLN